MTIMVMPPMATMVIAVMVVAITGPDRDARRLCRRARNGNATDCDHRSDQ
jgi:hypothetical protein